MRSADTAFEGWTRHFLHLRGSIVYEKSTVTSVSDTKVVQSYILLQNLYCEYS